MLLEKFRKPVDIAEKNDIILATETCFFNNLASAALAKKFIDELGSRI